MFSDKTTFWIQTDNKIKTIFSKRNGYNKILKRDPWRYAKEIASVEEPIIIRNKYSHKEYNYLVDRLDSVCSVRHILQRLDHVSKRAHDTCGHN